MFVGSEEDDLFNPNALSNSNLANLFSSSLSISQDDSQSLSYTAPKQPKTNQESKEKDQPKNKSDSSTVLLAKPILLFKQEEKKYVPQGKFGMALIGSDTMKTYELILYKDKQNILCRTSLYTGFTYKLQKDNFASFHDEKKQNWLVHFESSKDFTEMQEAIIKYGGKIVDKIKLETKVEAEEKKESEEKTETVETLMQVKNDVLARMAKMGQSVLPVVEKKEEESVEEEEKKVEVKPVRKARKNIPEKSRELSAPQKDTFMFSNQMVSLPATNIYPQPTQLYMPPPTLAPMCDFTGILTENRTNSNEMRLQLSHVSIKLDEVLWKLDRNSKSCESTSDARCWQSKVKALELKVENLERQLLEKCGAYLLLEKESEAFREGCQTSDNELQTEVDNLKELLLTQENVVEDLKKKLQQKESALVEKKSQLNAVNCVKMYLESAILSLKTPETVIPDFQSFLETIKDLNDFQGTDQHILTEVVSDTKKKLANLEKHYADNQSKSIDMSNRADAYREKVEQIMTHLYHNTVKHLAPAGDNLPADFTKKIFPRNLKTATVYILRAFQKDFNLPNALLEGNADKHSGNELDDSVIDLSD